MAHARASHRNLASSTLSASDSRVESNDDAALLNAVAAGDRGLFDIFVGRYRDRLYRFLWHQVGDAHRAEDLLQEVFLKSIRAARVGRGPRGADAAAWLFTIARRTVIDYRRACSARPLTLVADSGVLDARRSPPPSELALQEEAVDEAEAALSELPADQREAVVMRVYGELNFRQIGEIVGAPEATIKSRVYAGLAALRTRLSHADSEAR
jgi:RNA polymerase sigma-70 factor (ECF subfamily)